MNSLVIPDLAPPSEPVTLRLTHPYDETLTVKAGRSTRLVLILDETASEEAEGESRLACDVHLAPGACVKLVHLSRGGERVRRTARLRYFLKDHADLDVFSFVNGGAATDHEHQAAFEAPHGFASFKGLSVLHGRSVVRDRVIADHAAGQCTSRQYYKNVLAGSARSDFRSLVSVGRGAAGSDSRQLNKNLLLSDDARAEAWPELRIDTDDVSASHGAATGRVDEAELFYLRSRGLDEGTARYLLTLGFAEELLEGVEPEALRREILERVKAEIREALGFEVRV